MPRAGGCQPTFVSLMLAHGQLANFLLRHDQRFSPEPYLADFVMRFRQASKRVFVAGLLEENRDRFERELPQQIASQPLDRDMYVLIADSLRVVLIDVQSIVKPDDNGEGPNSIRVQMRTFQEQIVWLEAQHAATSNDKFVTCVCGGAAAVWALGTTSWASWSLTGLPSCWSAPCWRSISEMRAVWRAQSVAL